MAALRVYTNFALSCYKKVLLKPLEISSRQLSVETIIEREGAQASVIFKSGLPFDVLHEYDDAKKPNLWSHLKVFQAVRAYLWMVDGRLGGIKRLQGETKSLVFSFGGSYEVYPKLYDVAKFKPQTPVVMRCWIDAIGRSSMGCSHELRILESNELLSTFGLKFVSVDEKTHRPKAHPDWFLQKYLPLVQGPATVLMTPHKAKRQSFKHKTRVLPSDIDYQNHPSYLAYQRYCTDCATVAFQCNAMKNFTGSFTDYKVKKVQFLYLAAANLHDELDIDIWEDQKRSDTLNIVISKDGIDIFHGSIQLYV